MDAAQVHCCSTAPPTTALLAALPLKIQRWDVALSSHAPQSRRKRLQTKSGTNLQANPNQAKLTNSARKIEWNRFWSCRDERWCCCFPISSLLIFLRKVVSVGDNSSSLVTREDCCWQDAALGVCSLWGFVFSSTPNLACVSVALFCARSVERR